MPVVCRFSPPAHPFIQQHPLTGAVCVFFEQLRYGNKSLTLPLVHSQHALTVQDDLNIAPRCPPEEREVFYLFHGRSVIRSAAHE